MSCHYGLPVTSVHYQRVRAMMQGFGQQTPARPVVPDMSELRRVCTLVFEEALELVAACGFDVRLPPSAALAGASVGDLFAAGQLCVCRVAPPDMLAIVDALCDTSVVTMGGFVALGIPDEPFLACVDQNNLLKIATGHLDPVSGKFIKPANHPAPDLAGVLSHLTWEIQPQGGVDGDADSGRGRSGTDHTGAVLFAGA